MVTGIDRGLGAVPQAEPAENPRDVIFTVPSLRNKCAAISRFTRLLGDVTILLGLFFAGAFERLALAGQIVKD